MARRPKTPKYQEFNSAANAYGPRAQKPKDWITGLDPELPINLELGCGKAEQTLSLAQKYGEQNFIGVDLKADRLWRASKNAISLKLDNVAFIQSNILLLQEFIRANSVAMIWLTHPDPFLKDRQIKHSMLNRNFLDIYKDVLQKDGVVRLKTDNQTFFSWAQELLDEQPDIKISKLYNDLYQESSDPDLLFTTTYSDLYVERGTTIKYLEFYFI